MHIFLKLTFKRNISLIQKVFIIMQLKHKLTKKRVNIVCAHLKAYEEYSEKRAEQIEFILNCLRECLDDPTTGSESLEQQACIFCGDLNGERAELFYELLMKNEHFSFSDAYLKQYNEIISKEKGFRFKNVDYILYTRNSLRLVNYLDLCDSSMINNKKFYDSLPSLSYPSDHLSLVCDFQFF